jgi:hypothetical protein
MLWMCKVVVDCHQTYAASCYSYVPQPFHGKGGHIFFHLGFQLLSRNNLAKKLFFKPAHVHAGNAKGRRSEVTWRAIFIFLRSVALISTK